VTGFRAAGWASPCPGVRPPKPVELAASSPRGGVVRESLIIGRRPATPRGASIPWRR